MIDNVRPKYACKACQANVVIAQRLPEPIEKGLPGSGLLAHVIVSKYSDHLPLYRQEGIFRRHGVELSRQTMCDWMAISAELLEPIVKEMHREILKSRVIQTDDTTVPVLDRSLGKTRTGRLWDYLGDRDHPHVVYDYTPDRSAEGPLRMLEGYEGYLQADAYSAYDSLYASKKIIEVGCWAHARRKFYDARTSDPVRSHVAMAMIQRLYRVEKDAKDLDDAVRRALRQERSKPVLKEIETWLLQEKDRALPKSPISEAIGYALNHWQALERYTDEGWLSIDNNASERGMKPVALGRKNWLFAGSDAGGKTAATLMSLCMTCKNLAIDSFAYLRDVLERISTHPARRIGELLPDQWKTERAARSRIRWSDRGGHLAGGGEFGVPGCAGRVPPWPSCSARGATKRRAGRARSAACTPPDGYRSCNGHGSPSPVVDLRRNRDPHDVVIGQEGVEVGQ